MAKITNSADVAARAERPEKLETEDDCRKLAEFEYEQNPDNAKLYPDREKFALARTAVLMKTHVARYARVARDARA